MTSWTLSHTFSLAMKRAMAGWWGDLGAARSSGVTSSQRDRTVTTGGGGRSLRKQSDGLGEGWVAAV
jgi:hypothetical protein